MTIQLGNNKIVLGTNKVVEPQEQLRRLVWHLNTDGYVQYGDTIGTFLSQYNNGANVVNEFNLQISYMVPSQATFKYSLDRGNFPSWVIKRYTDSERSQGIKATFPVPAERAEIIAGIQPFGGNGGSEIGLGIGTSTTSGVYLKLTESSGLEDEAYVRVYSDGTLVNELFLGTGSVYHRKYLTIERVTGGYNAYQNGSLLATIPYTPNDLSDVYVYGVAELSSRASYSDPSFNEWRVWV